MNTISRLFAPFRAGRLALTVALCGLAVTSIPATSQNAFVGLSALRSTLFVERTQEGFGPLGGDLFGASFVAADFSGDGMDELVTGIPGDDCTSTVLNCGAVFLSWGNPIGLFDQGGFLWEGAPGAPTPAVEHDRYGQALAAGDFNNDGLADLVIGAPGGFFFAETGDVRIHYGLPGAIQVLPEHVLRPGVGGVPITDLHDNTRDARFGRSFASGDWNGDGHDDLAIGAPEWSFEDGAFRAGAVVVAHGHIGGLVPFDGYFVSQDEAGIPDAAETGDRFATALAGGDFNGDGFDDLVIGAPGEDGVGAILVLFGSPNSLIFANHYWLGEVDLGSTGASGDRFGETLATGDFNNDGFDDLVVGAPGQDDGDGDFDIGMIGVLYGAPGSPLSDPPGGFNFAATRWWWEDLLGSISADGDEFGGALTTGDFDGDGFDDLAVATPFNDGSRGAVTVLAGGPNLLPARIGRFVAGQQGLPGAPGTQAAFRFGEALVAGDFDGDGFDDLVVGAPRLDVGSEVDAGGEFVLYGSLFSNGFESGSSSLWSSELP